MECENCHREHNGSYGSGRFCSDHCRRSYCASQRKQFPTREELQARNFGNKPAVFGTWKCSKCNKVFETRQLLQTHRKENHPELIGHAWNKGLTKETDNRVLNGAQKYHNNYVNGYFSLGGWKQSLSARQKISNSKVKNHDIYGGFKHVKWYTTKNLNGIEYVVRGKWELNVSKRLNQLGYIWEKNRWLKYSFDDGIIHHYNPDFYIPSINSFVEVKGYYSISDQYKMKAVMKWNPNIKIFFLSKLAYKDFCFNGAGLTERMLLNISTCQNSYGTLS